MQLLERPTGRRYEQVIACSGGVFALELELSCQEDIGGTQNKTFGGFSNSKEKKESWEKRQKFQDENGVPKGTALYFESGFGKH